MFARASTIALVSASISVIGACAATPSDASEPAPPEPEVSEPEPEPPSDANTEPGPITETEAAPAPAPAPPADPQARDLAATIRDHLLELQPCYEAELPNDPSLAGKMQITITIESNGRIGGVGIDIDTVGSRAVQACVIRTIDAWSFTPPAEPEPIELTFSVAFRRV